MGEKKIILNLYYNILKNNNIIIYCNNLCEDCKYCNNCLNCDLNKRLFNVLDWLEYNIQNNIKENEIEEKYIYKFIELKKTVCYHYNNINKNIILKNSLKENYKMFNNVFNVLINFCLKIINDKKLDELNVINDCVIIELFNNILQNILKVKANILSSIIINDINNNNSCEFINNQIINNILLYFNNNYNLILDFINNPKYYKDYLTNLFYVDYLDNI